MLETALESKSTNLLPKRIINPPIQAGLGATFASMIPILEAYETNTPLASGAVTPIQAFGQAQIANTVAPIMGVGMHWSNAIPNKLEMFYDKPDDETALPTASATTVAGGTITINDGKYLEVLMGSVSTGVVTASEALISSMQFNSNDFENSLAEEIVIQPVNSGLSTLIGMMQAKHSIYKNVHQGMKSTCKINTVLRLSQALTVAGNFIGCVGYTK